MRKFLTNQIAENLLIGIILLFNSQQWIFKIVPPNNLYKHGTIRKVKRKGIHYQLDISDYQEWLVYFYCKSDSSDYVLKYLGKSQIIFDIGANIGQTAFNMSLTQQKKGLNPLVYAFEPYPRTFHKLEANKILNPNIFMNTYNLALGEQKGILHMTQHSPRNSGGYRMTDNSKEGISVPVTTLDQFVQKQNISQVDFIKIDVEGFEVQVLNGAKLTLEKFKPILVFEYSMENILAQGGEIEQLLDQLIQMNYAISTKEGISDMKTILSLNYQTDLICLPS